MLQMSGIRRILVIGIALVVAVVAQVSVPLQAARAVGIAFVASDHSAPQAQKLKTVTIPAQAQPGDTLVLIFTRASAVTWTGPIGAGGWSPVDSFDSGGLVSTVYRGSVGVGDPGSVVRFETSSYAKALLTLAVYRGADVNAALVTSHAADGSAVVTHATAAAPVVAGSSLVSYWVDRSANTTAWAAPPRSATRDIAIGTGTGRYGGVLADEMVSNDGASASSAGVSSPATRALMWTIVLAPSGGSGPVDTPPTARFTASCSALVCVFDGSSSSDLEGPVALFTWDFGDGQTAVGPVATHPYTGDGLYPVMLTVSDSAQRTSTVTHDVSVTQAATTAVSFVGAEHSDPASQRVKRVGVPAAAHAGDVALLLFTRATNVSWSAPSGIIGWTEIASTTQNGLSSSVYTKTLTVTDLGQSVTFTAPKYAKAMLTMAAYAGVGGSVTATSGSDRQQTQHLTPASKTGAGDWIVSYWVDRRATTSAWTAPSAVVRDTAIGTGTGPYNALLADDAGDNTGGDRPGRVGSTENATDALMWSVLLSPGPSLPPPPPPTSTVTKLLVIVEENRTTAAYDQMPYLRGLSGTYGQATAYRGLVHPSTGNYLAMVSGQGADTCGLHNPLPALCAQPGSTVFGQAVGSGLSARTYSESMTSPCQGTNTSLYAARHNPWVYFPQEAPLCAGDDVTVGTLASGPLASDIDTGTLPHAGMLIPNLQNDAHDGTLAQADSWLQTWLPRIMAGPDYQSGRLAVVVTFDEGVGPDQNIPFVMVHRALSQKTVSTAYTHYGLARMYSDILGTAPLGAASTEPGLKAAFGL